MAEFSLNINSGILAVIVGGNKTMTAGEVLKLDPITESYSTIGELCYYMLSIVNLDPPAMRANILQNGVNSRITIEDAGLAIVQLEVRDDNNNSDTTTILITVN